MSLPSPESARRARAREHVRGLYGIVDLPPVGADLPARAHALGRALLDAGVRVIQLRMKRAEARAMLHAAAPLRTLATEASALFVVNDRLDVALAAGADGVHLGQDDLPLEETRRIAPPTLLVGVSTHDERQAEAAFRAGADYLGFGPVFATRSKENPDPVVGTARLAAVCASVGVPVVGIGGIGLESVAEVARAGAAAAAIISAVNGAPDVTKAARVAQAAFKL